MSGWCALILSSLIAATSVSQAASRQSRGPVLFMTGTFDPVHTGHLNMAQTGLREMNASRVIFVPNPVSETDGKHPADLRLRRQMISLSLDGKTGLELADERIQRAFAARG